MHTFVKLLLFNHSIVSNIRIQKHGENYFCGFACHSLGNLNLTLHKNTGENRRNISKVNNVVKILFPGSQATLPKGLVWLQALFPAQDPGS